MNNIDPHDIIDTKIVNNTTYNLVLCKEHGIKMKLWIPEYFVSNDSKKSKINDSNNLIDIPPKPMLTIEEKVNQIYHQLSKATDEELLNMQKQVIRLNFNDLPPSSKPEINTTITKLIHSYQTAHKVSPIFVKKLRHDILQEEMTNKRRKQLSMLFCLEKEINLVSKSSKKINIMNFVDLEILPFDFSYIKSNIAGTGVSFSKNPPIGCDCIGKRICLLNNCCPEMFNSQATYNEAGEVTVSPNMPIYECNKNCKCSKSCSNRVVQRGSNIQLTIFRTRNNNWGVQASEFIKKGKFVAEYVGEVVKRENIINLEDFKTRYLFDLNFNTNDDNYLYTVNSWKHGNISRFINHSCNPNLDVYSVWINSSDPNNYHIALFASRDIHSGEELTFYYKCKNLFHVDNCSCNSCNVIKNTE